MEILFSALGFFGSHLHDVFDLAQRWFVYRSNVLTADEREAVLAARDEANARASIRNRPLLIVRFAFSTVVIVAWGLNLVDIMKIDWQTTDDYVVLMVFGFWFGDGDQIFRRA